MNKKNAQKHRLRFNLWQNQSGKCVYCGRQTWILGRHKAGSKDLQATLEHVIPACDGGTNQPNNLVCSCTQCNKHRGHMPHDVFKKVRACDDWELRVRAWGKENIRPPRAPGFFTITSPKLRHSRRVKSASYIFNREMCIYIRPYRTFVYL